jgi:polyferredoxin
MFGLYWHTGCKKEGVRHYERNVMPTIVWIVVILLLLSALPVYPYSSSWGYYPSGGLGLLLIILILLAVFRGGGI